tara:strand:+ start:240 stop:860 length:621 start_codon:yes stop_codon:yes gene_type:complete
MVDIFDIIVEYSYFGIFLLLIGINAAPILIPPTWIVLSSFFALDNSLDPLLLALVGATGATIGRLILKNLSSFFRRFVSKEQKSNLDVIGNFLNRKKFGYILTSFLFAATPLPSNMLFVAYGMMKAKSIGIYFGFWMGRLLSYYIMITVSSVVLTPFLELFEDKIIGILVVDIASIGVVVVFTCINWQTLLLERKLQFVRPKLWKF